MPRIKRTAFSATLALLIVLGGGCLSGERQSAVDADVNDEELIKAEGDGVEVTNNEVISHDEYKITFDGKEVAVGDTVRGMRVEKIYGTSGFDFSGQVEITGTYEFGTGETGFPGDSPEELCFSDLDEASINKMPKADQDSRYIWFCFTNASAVASQFKNASGTATIVIDNYSVGLGDRPTVNSAELVSVTRVQ